MCVCVCVCVCNIITLSSLSLQHHKAYVDAYQLYRSNLNTRDAAKFTSAYNNAHNEYILQLRMTNCLEQEYHQSALPYLLEVRLGAGVMIDNLLIRGYKSLCNVMIKHKLSVQELFGRYDRDVIKRMELRLYANYGNYPVKP